MQAATALDLLLQPELVVQAWDYFHNVQTKDQKYAPRIAPQDQPPLDLSAKTMREFAPALRKLYFDPVRLGICLEQIGVQHPTVRR